MKLKWLGHSHFVLTAASGAALTTDPFDAKVGYPLRRARVDVATLSHDHYDHNYTASLDGDFKVIRTAGRHSAAGFEIEGFAAYHDEVEGKKRGTDVMFKIVADGITFLHLGDLGHMLGAETRSKIGKIDVLMTPVGGNYTIDAMQAAELCAQIAPEIVVPMHYKDDYSALDIGPLQPFLDHLRGYSRIDCENEITLEAGKLKRGVCVFKF
jgi:L-ascorbate metabolism protein UlaG (beta-lactamase superfamily)